MESKLYIPSKEVIELEKKYLEGIDKLWYDTGKEEVRGLVLLARVVIRQLYEDRTI